MKRLALWLGLGLLLAGCTLNPWQATSSRSQAPPKESAYTEFSAFWDQAAGSLKLGPEEGRLSRWNLGYDAEGEILYMTFQLYVNREAGRYDVYSFSQVKGGVASWSRVTVEGAVPAEAVPAHLAFAAVDQIGLRRLEEHQGLTPPVRFWFSAATGSTNYRPIAGGYLIQDGHFIPIAPEGMTVRGDHGVFGIAEGAQHVDGSSAVTASPADPGPSLFLVPLPPRN